MKPVSCRKIAAQSGEGWCGHRKGLSWFSSEVVWCFLRFVVFRRFWFGMLAPLTRLPDLSFIVVFQSKQLVYVFLHETQLIISRSLVWKTSTGS